MIKMSTTERYQAAKKKAMPRRYSMEDLRNNIRKEFKNRVTSLRNKHMDAHRQICKKNILRSIVNQGFSELQETLLTDKEGVALLDTNTVLKVLSEVQAEILEEELEREADFHEKDVQLETDMLVEHLLNVCSVCDKYTDDLNSNICINCADAYFTANIV